MFRDVLKFRKMSTRDLCMLAMLIAVTAVLSFLSGLLKTPVGKLNVSFISVYVCAVLYGPIAGGIVGAMADLFSVLFAASGAPILLFTVIEFVNGFIFGILFYRMPKTQERKFITIVLLAILCSAIQYVFNLFRIPILAEFQNLTYWQTFILRIPSTTLMFVVKIIGIALIEPYINKFIKLVR